MLAQGDTTMPEVGEPLRQLEGIAGLFAPLCRNDAQSVATAPAEQGGGAKAKRRNRPSRSAALLLALLETDRSNLNKARRELARELNVSPGTITRAFQNAKYSRRFEEMYNEAGIAMPTIDQI